MVHEASVDLTAASHGVFAAYFNARERKCAVVDAEVFVAADDIFFNVARYAVGFQKKGGPSFAVFVKRV